MGKDKDDIFGVDDDMSFLDEKSKIDTAINPPTEITSTSTQESVQTNDIGGNGKDGYPKLMGATFPKEYADVVESVMNQYRKLPKIDYDAIYKEISGLTIRSCPTPTLQIINQELQRVQAAKERLSEIMTNVLQCYTLKKRAVDILRDSWGYFSNEKSADKRKGDSIYRLSDFDIDFAQTEALLKATSHISRNLEGLQENLSRRITIFQLQLKLHDIGRGALPEFELKDDIDAEFGLLSKSPKDPSEGIEAETHHF